MPRTLAFAPRIEAAVPGDVSFRFAPPDEDVQTAGDDRPVRRLLAKRLQPGAAVDLADDARLDGSLRATVSHARIETLRMGLDREEATRADVREARALEERRQRSDEPAVDRRRVGGCGDDAPRETAIGMRERGHVCVEVEDAETPS